MKNNLEVPKFVADTHAVIWHMMDSSHLSTEARRRFQEADRGDAVIYVSAITPIEMTYLVEKRKIPEIVLEQFYRNIEDLEKDSYKIFDITYELTKAFQKVPRKAVPELPDRVIAATAFHLNLPLITKDKRLHAWEGVITIW